MPLSSVVEQQAVNLKVARSTRAEAANNNMDTHNNGKK